MIRKFTAFGLGLGMLLSLCTTAFAETLPTVTFDGNAEKFISNVDIEHFGDAFEGIAPGETRTQDFTIKNSDDQSKDIYFSAKALEDLLDGGSAYYFISFLRDGQPFYRGTLGGPNGALTDLGAPDTPLGSPVLLATLENGESCEMSMIFTLDGASTGNEYQAKDGLFQFTFSASDAITPAPTGTPTPSRTTYTRPGTITTAKGVKTFDSAPLLPLCGLLLLSLIGFAVVNWDLIFHRKKHR
ncbi:MAG: hypothetical protein PHS82_14050 [Lachnospiraceae bacterium]|nr:hypothetical protein [Lachnospiraceae bacterium]